MALGPGFYTRQGECLEPTGLGVSPWDPDKQGGAPVAGLVAQLLDAVPTAVPMVPLRLTIDLLGAVPMGLMTPHVRVVRDGRRVQLAELELAVDGRARVRASLLRVRSEGREEAGSAPTYPFPEPAKPVTRVIAESIRIAGDDQVAGPGAIWLRVITPMICGEPMNPLGSLAAAADWGTNVSPPVPPREWRYPTLDLSLHVMRMPRGEWLLLDGNSETAANGAAIVRLRLGDRAGMFGTAQQSVFLDRKPAGDKA